MGTDRTSRGIKFECRQAGFTLVELLVAMTLLAFLSVMLFGGLRFGARSWEAVASSSTERDQIAATQTFLRDRLGELTLPGNFRSRNLGEDGGLSGEPQQVEFVAPWLSALSLGGLYQFTLWYDDSEDGRLMLRWRPAEADPEAQADLEGLGDLVGERVLLDGVDEFNLSYYGAVDEDGDPDWLERWENPVAPPRLVRVELIFADARRLWPGFVVATKF